MRQSANTLNQLPKSTIYIVEEKISNAERAFLIDWIKEKNFKNEIRLLIRLSEEWVITGSLAFSTSFNDIVEKYVECVENYPMSKYRILKVLCVYHEQSGIDLQNYDYKRISLFKKPLRYLLFETLSKIKYFIKFSKRPKKLNYKMIMQKKRFTITD